MPPRIPHGRLAFLVASFCSIGPFAIDAYLPAFPAIGAGLSATPVQVQQSLTLYLLAFAFMMLWHGAISDAVGRRRVLLGAFAVFTVASVGAAMAGTIEQFWGWRLLQGASSGAGMTVGRAMIRDVVDGAVAQKVMSQSTVVFAVAPAVAPVIGGWIYEIWGWRATMGMLAVIGLALVLLTAIWVPETLPRERRQSLHPADLARGYWGILRMPAFWRLSGTLAGNFLGFFLYILAAPVFLLDHLKVAPTDFWWLSGPAMVGTMSGGWLASRQAGKISLDRAIRRGYAVMLATGVANVAINLAMPPTLPWAVLPIAAYTFGMGLSMAALQVKLLDLAPERRGMISSCQNFNASLLNAVGAGVVVPLLWGSTLTLAAGMAVLVFVAAVLYARHRGTASERAARARPVAPG